MGGVQFDRNSAQRIAKQTRRSEATRYNAMDLSGNRPRRGVDLYMGRTTADAFSYPSAQANTYEITLVEKIHGEAVGQQTVTELTNGPTVVACYAGTASQAYIPENTLVEVWRSYTRKGPRWWWNYLPSFAGFWSQDNTVASFGSAGIQLAITSANDWFPWGVQGFTPDESTDVYTCTVGGLYEISWRVGFTVADCQTATLAVYRDSIQGYTQTIESDNILVEADGAADDVDTMSLIGADEFEVGDELYAEVAVYDYATGSPTDPETYVSTLWVKRLWEHESIGVYVPI